MDQAAAGRSARAALFAFVLVLAAWLPSVFGAGFSFDDREAIEANPVVEGSLPWRAAFERDYWEHRGAAGHFRPLATLTLRIDRALFGEHAAGFRATNALLHALTAAAAAWLMTRILLGARGREGPGEARAPLSAGVILFAVHPALADSVAWISGSSSMLSALPGLVAAALLARDPEDSTADRPANANSLPGFTVAFLLGLLGVGLAFLGKEDGIVFLAMLPLVALRRGRSSAAATFVGGLLGVACVFSLRAHALGTPWIEAPHAPLAAAALHERLLVGGRTLVEAARVFAFPFLHPPSYAGDPAFEPAAVLAEPALPLAALACYAGAACAVAGKILRAHGRASPAVFGLGLALAAWVPFLGIVPAGEVFAPRFLYLPLLFLAPCVDVVVARVASALPSADPLPRRRMARVLAWTATLALVFGASVRAGVYESRASFRLAVLAARPDDAPSWNDLGLAHEEDGRLADAERAWRRATELDPRYSRAWSNLGRVALAAGRTAEALELLARAVREGPRNPAAHVNLGAAFLASGDFAGAERSYRRALELAPGLEAAHLGLERTRERENARSR